MVEGCSVGDITARRGATMGGVTSAGITVSDGREGDVPSNTEVAWPLIHTHACAHAQDTPGFKPPLGGSVHSWES